MIVTVSLKEMINLFLGQPGHVCSVDKECGPPMVIYNACLVINKEILWRGDIDLDQKRFILCSLGKMFSVIVDIYSHTKKLGPDTNQLPLWSSRTPHAFNGISYADVKEDAEMIRSINVKNRLIVEGVLTPNGTEYTWYNTWYYKLVKVWRRMCSKHA